MTAVSRESHIVELVDQDGVPVGSTTVDEAHRAPGRLHRAFSVFLRDPTGRVLLQQRAAVKTRFPLRWANTCCGHPEPAEAPTVAGVRRLAEEIGITGAELIEVGVYTYYAEDPASGRVEYEYDHVLLGDLPVGHDLLPDPDEVADTRWVSIPQLQREIAAEPRLYAPWLAGVTERLAEYLALPARQTVPNSGSDATALSSRSPEQPPASPGGASAEALASARKASAEPLPSGPETTAEPLASPGGAWAEPPARAFGRGASENLHDGPKRSSGGR